MKRLFGTLQRKMNARRLLAASLLVIALVDIGSHAFTTAEAWTGGPLEWCVKYHYDNSGVDCPHKRDHRMPDTSSFGDTGHNAILESKEEFQISGIIYRTELPTAPEVRIVTRSLEPPTQPPKQA
jgi:hypothetical protein